MMALQDPHPSIGFVARSAEWLRMLVAPSGVVALCRGKKQGTRSSQQFQVCDSEKRGSGPLRRSVKNFVPEHACDPMVGVPVKVGEV